MPGREQEQDTICRNIGLVATRWNIFVFLIHPLVSCAWMIYTCFRMSKGGILSSNAHFAFAVLIWPVSAMLLAMVTGSQITERLEQDGYVQKRTRAREIDLMVNVAVFGAFMYWVQNYESDGQEGALATGIFVVFGGFMIWGIIVMMSLGPVLWFTVKVRNDDGM